MKAGLNIDSEKVFLEVPSGGVHITVEMGSKVARALASQLVASAEALDKATEDGFFDVAD